VSELLEIGGVDFVGVLPEGAQRVTTFSAGLAAGAKEPDAARQLVRFFKSPEAEPVIRRAGLAPARP
jgi:molybdate transport system substrate-binding protein